MSPKRSRPRKGGIPATTRVCPTSGEHYCHDCRGDVSTVEGILVYAHGNGCPVLANEEATRRVDRAYFDEHPDTVSYVRRLMPGDLGVVSLECIMATADGLPPTVRITRIADGVRAVSIGGEGMPWVVNPLTLDGQRVAAFLAGGDR